MVVHTQAYQVVQSTLRILHDEMKLRVVIDHGTFDSYKISKEIIKREIPVMAGPRGFRLEFDDGQIKVNKMKSTSKGPLITPADKDSVDKIRHYCRSLKYDNTLFRAWKIEEEGELPNLEQKIVGSVPKMEFIHPSGNPVLAIRFAGEDWQPGDIPGLGEK